MVENDLQAAKLKVTELETQLRINKKTVERLEAARQQSENDLEGMRRQLQEEKTRSELGGGNAKRLLEARVKELTRELDAEIEAKAELSRQKRSLKRENKRLQFKLDGIERDKSKTASRYERSNAVAEAGGEQTRLLQLKVDDLTEKLALAEKRLQHAILVKEEAVREKERYERRIERLDDDEEKPVEVEKPKRERKAVERDEPVARTVSKPSEELVEPIAETAEDIVGSVAPEEKSTPVDDLDEDAIEAQIQKELEEQMRQEELEAN